MGLFDDIRPRKATPVNTSKLRSKRILIPTGAAVAALVVGGVIWSATASADDVSGGERDRVAAAATDAVGSGKVLSVETSDDPGEAYDVEIRQDDGTEVDVTLDSDLRVVELDTDGPGDNDRDDAEDNSRDDNDADDRALSAAERTSAEKAALDAVGSGTVVDTDASDDRGVAYEVEVRANDGTEWNVDLDADFTVVSKNVDR